jgi:hypothetical protein
LLLFGRTAILESNEELFSFILGRQLVNALAIRNSSSRSATGPDFAFIMSNRCIFRGEERANNDPAPYLLGRHLFSILRSILFLNDLKVAIAAVSS